MARAVIPNGTQVAIARLDQNGDPLDFVDIVTPGDFSLPSSTREEIDITSHDSPGDYREYMPSGRRDAGSITVPTKYVPGSDQAVLFGAISSSAELLHVRFILPGGSAEIFVAYVSDFTRNVPVNGVLESEITFRLSGLVL